MSNSEYKRKMISEKGILRPNLLMGVVSSVSAYAARINLSEAGAPSGTHFEGSRYGRGEVGEFVLIGGQTVILLGRVTEVKLPERERPSIQPAPSQHLHLDAIGTVQLLGSISMDEMQVIAGVVTYPRLGDRVYAAPHEFVSLLPKLMEAPKGEKDESVPVEFNLGSIGGKLENSVMIRPEKLFGRHCAILGTTGGGKSWTTARIIEECMAHDSKIILLDATGEYHNFKDPSVVHCHLGESTQAEETSLACSLPPTFFAESDFMAMFDPSPGAQMPKFRDALLSLRAVQADDTLGRDGVFVKTDRSFADVIDIFQRDNIVRVANNPESPFEVQNLIRQLREECAYLNDNKYGNIELKVWGYCSTLVSRISSILNCQELSFIFGKNVAPTLPDVLSNFFDTKPKKVLRISTAHVTSQYQAREITANVIGRYLLKKAREDIFKQNPTVVFVDEAHNYLGRKIGHEDSATKLDAFELIAKEGRKYGLTICLATQRPRDITEGVLSQMGTLIVHRLTNDRDRELVERACGEIDRSSVSFLPNLKPGEAAIIGVDFPIPLTIQMSEPSCKPDSKGPDYQQYWNTKSSENPTINK